MGATFPLSPAAIMHRRGGGLGVIAAAAVGIFALGFVAGTALRRPASAPARPALAALGASEPAARAATNPQTYNAQFAYAAEVVRVIDGDTFEARVHVWPGLDVTTKVRLRNIDAPELHARCADESTKAQTARTALEQMLAAGGVMLSRVGIDKYGGRIDAVVATRDAVDLSAALLGGGFARAYDGRRRSSWC